MKSVVALFVVFVAIEANSLTELLHNIHNSPAFQHLPHPQQIIVVELMAAVRLGEAHEYIDEVGFAAVLTIIDHLPEREAHAFTAALIKELNIEELHTTTKAPVAAVGKRDLTSLLHTIVTSASYQQLSATDQSALTELVTATENHRLTDYISKVGYAAVLTLLDDLTEHDAHKLTSYITQHLKMEDSHQTVGR